MEFKPRDYQKIILNDTEMLANNEHNVLIELDCGLGKRFLQLMLISSSFPEKKILLLLQASTSLYETYNYLKEHYQDNDLGYIDSRSSSHKRKYTLENKRVVLCLPQTLANTIKKYPGVIHDFELVLINEVDQILRRMGHNSSLKIPYPELFRGMEGMTLVGMSGTLRDEHYVASREQIMIKRELESLQKILPGTMLITMDKIIEESNDLEEHINTSHIIPTAVKDTRMSFISDELELHIEDVKNKVLEELKVEDIQLYYDAKKDFSILFGPLPIEPDLLNKFHQSYLVRKYLWAMNSEKSRIHLIRYGLDKDYVYNTVPELPGKFKAVRELVKDHHKSVVLCSYLDTVATIDKMLQARGIKTAVISGGVSQVKRAEALEEFRISEEKAVAILSNVGERDLDIPEANLLIIFDLVNTTKTVYQKLKRSRGGEVRILFYDETKEMKKVKSVVDKIAEKYPWSTEIMPMDFL